MRVKCLAQEHNAVPWPGLEPEPPDLESSRIGPQAILKLFLSCQSIGKTCKEVALFNVYFSVEIRSRGVTRIDHSSFNVFLIFSCYFAPLIGLEYFACNCHEDSLLRRRSFAVVTQLS